jgi:hypothetical protein
MISRDAATEDLGRALKEALTREDFLRGKAYRRTRGAETGS